MCSDPRVRYVREFMKQFIFLTMLALISFVFFKSAIALWRYHKFLQEKDGSNVKRLQQERPNIFIMMKVVMPLIVFGFAFNSVAAAVVFIFISWGILWR